MIWLLRLFAAYRHLEADLDLCRSAAEELTNEKLRLQDRLEAAIADKEQLWSVMQEALSGERDALRMQVNHAVQRGGGGIPYPEAHSLPPALARPPQPAGSVGRRGRQLTSEMEQRSRNKFAEEFVTQQSKRA